MLTRMSLLLVTATLLSGCVVSFAPENAAAPSARALAIQAQQRDGLRSLAAEAGEPSAAVELAGVVAAR